MGTRMEDVESMMRILTIEGEAGTEKFDGGMLAASDADVGVDV